MPRGALPEAELGRRENQDMFGVAGGCYVRWLPEWQAAFGDALRVEFFDTLVAEESAATNASNPVGTGPFKFLRWRRGASATLVRNDDYWGNRPALDQP